VLPVTFPSLLLSSVIVFTIYDIQGPGKAVSVGSATMSLFKDRWVLLRQRWALFRQLIIEP